jgi:hypothetical protein
VVLPVLGKLQIQTSSSFTSRLSNWSFNSSYLLGKVNPLDVDVALPEGIGTLLLENLVEFVDAEHFCTIRINKLFELI